MHCVLLFDKPWCAFVWTKASRCDKALTNSVADVSNAPFDHELSLVIASLYEHLAISIAYFFDLPGLEAVNECLCRARYWSAAKKLASLKDKLVAIGTRQYCSLVRTAMGHSRTQLWRRSFWKARALAWAASRRVSLLRHLASNMHFRMFSEWTLSSWLIPNFLIIDERTRIKELVEGCGGEYSGSLDRRCTHLLTEACPCSNPIFSFEALLDYRHIFNWNRHVTPCLVSLNNDSSN
jgi:hypothetical protein